MQWWIGQVTDPDKGEWGDSYERKQAEDGEDICLLYTSPSPRDLSTSRMPSSA